MTQDGSESNRPKSDAFRQQKLKSWQPIMTPLKVIVLFFAVGIAFIPTGVRLLAISNAVYEQTIIYDSTSPDVDCTITTQNEGRLCNVSIIREKLHGTG
jgi:hypothetical protein